MDILAVAPPPDQEIREIEREDALGLVRGARHLGVGATGGAAGSTTGAGLASATAATGSGMAAGAAEAGAVSGVAATGGTGSGSGIVGAPPEAFVSKLYRQTSQKRAPGVRWVPQSGQVSPVPPAAGDGAVPPAEAVGAAATPGVPAILAPQTEQ